MSNALNSSLARAWFSADIAANKFELYNEKRKKEEDFADLLERLEEEKIDAIEEEQGFGTAGSFIGAAIGFAVGGPGGAYAGWKIGEGAGEFAYGITHGEDDLDALQEEIEDFDWELGQLGDKYQALASQKYEDKGEDIAETASDAFQKWQDDFYDPWYEDLINDVAIPIAMQYTPSQIEAFAWDYTPGFIQDFVVETGGTDWMSASQYESYTDKFFARGK